MIGVTNFEIQAYENIYCIESNYVNSYTTINTNTNIRRLTCNANQYLHSNATFEYAN